MTSRDRDLPAREATTRPLRRCRDCGADVPPAKTRCPRCRGADVQEVDPARPATENFFVATIGAEVNNIRRPDV